MTSVPRPVDTPDPSTDAEQLRTLLARIAEVLDVPADGDVEEARIVTRERAILAKHAARMASLEFPVESAVQMLHGVENLGGAK